MNIPFNIPYTTGQELHYIGQAIAAHKTAGDGHFTKLCQSWMEEQYGFKKCLLTTSCTDALELAALLIDLKAGDEVIGTKQDYPNMINAWKQRASREGIVYTQLNFKYPIENDEEIISVIGRLRHSSVTPWITYRAHLMLHLV